VKYFAKQPTFSPRKLRILNTHSAHQQTICELNFVSSILAVKLNMKRMIVVMETKIHVYDINTLKILHSIDTVTNPEGLAALCPGDNSYVAYPGTKGAPHDTHHTHTPHTPHTPTHQHTNTHRPTHTLIRPFHRRRFDIRCVESLYGERDREGP
jgi:autophagy-related protein 18